ncbi:hypothetical protein DAPPUDRAFT_327500 [Daphnia pulex]|uniref:Uncharacterized protein n=1 Tax=Daphnia pulex TaxID=6669 RepID=E9HAX3_DAPPU|nr:hypothetical protein DAPPUDRAFT_327500 [Daphnia pulex]|eukprot:EFX71145.1 hypothetical protein DAPPUDRAFT_327500 [Daphnia pulex]
MKLLLSFLLLGLACLATGVRPPMPHARQARARYVPLFYANGIPAGYDFFNDDRKAEEILPRNNINDTPLGRLFGNLLLPNLMTRTSTTTVVAVSTVTSAVYVTCIPKADFSVVAAANAPAPAVLATTACARRRRHASELLAEAVDIQPASPSAMETSAIPDSIPVAQDQPELLSSKSDQIADKAELRLGNAPVATTNWVTVSSIAYTFVPQTITSTKDLAGAAGLQCLPAGFLVCAA